jgi:hypothetical protein
VARVIASVRDGGNSLRIVVLSWIAHGWNLLSCQTKASNVPVLTDGASLAAILAAIESGSGA